MWLTVSTPSALFCDQNQGEAVALNNNNVSVGYCGDPIRGHPNGTAVMWDANGVMTRLGGTTGKATAINNRGEIVGSDRDGVFVYHPAYGKISLWRFLPLQSVSLNDINDNGEILGTGTDPRNFFRTVLFRLVPIN